MSSRGVTLEWVGKAEEDASVAERERRVRSHPSPGAVCYHAQQCIEKYLKAVLQEKSLPIPKTHDLAVLLDLCAEVRCHLTLDRDGLVALTRYATRFRYPGDAATADDAKLAIKLMRRFREELRGHLGIRSGDQGHVSCGRCGLPRSPRGYAKEQSSEASFLLAVLFVLSQSVKRKCAPHVAAILTPTPLKPDHGPHGFPRQHRRRSRRHA